jgi:DNA repair exonuclease SbcCD ATPase subunit
MRTSFNVQLIQLARDAARQLSERTEYLQGELQKLEERKAQLEAEIAMARSAVTQADSFSPELSGDYQCPYCWVERDVHAKLKPIEGEENVDWFRCEVCAVKFSQPSR